MLRRRALVPSAASSVWAPTHSPRSCVGHVVPASVLRSIVSATVPEPVVADEAVNDAVISAPRYLSVLLSTVLLVSVPVVADTDAALMSVCSVDHDSDPSDANLKKRALTVTVMF